MRIELPLFGHRVGITEHRNRRGGRRVPADGRVVVGEHLIGPVQHLLSVRFRNADEVGDGMHR
ncbi:Uncharacterised protein [Mycobacteroides abscessus subsp. abscessus]|nr:Uncharacterised protein [Mycobacteroides abscessus subsp. abscessus]